MDRTFWWSCGICSPAVVDDVICFLMTLQAEEGINCAEQF